jgi:hypothetical protein
VFLVVFSGFVCVACKLNYQHLVSANCGFIKLKQGYGLQFKKISIFTDCYSSKRAPIVSDRHKRFILVRLRRVSDGKKVAVWFVWQARAAGRRILSALFFLIVSNSKRMKIDAN